MSIVNGASYFQGTNMTQRGPETLSRYYGFESVEAMAASLPPHAKVLDAGAGASTLGHAIAGMRPDIDWTNLDVGYADRSALAALAETAPPNLTLAEGNIMNVGEMFEPGHFDRIFSYWALWYLGQKQAKEAVGRLIEVAKPTGQLAVGMLILDGQKAGCTITVSPSENEAFRRTIQEHIAGALYHPAATCPTGSKYVFLDRYKGQDTVR